MEQSPFSPSEQAAAAAVAAVVPQPKAVALAPQVGATADSMKINETCGVVIQFEDTGNGEMYGRQESLNTRNFDEF